MTNTILLINPPFFARFSRSQRSPAVTKSGTLYYPIWLAYAAGVLEHYGYPVTLLDAPAQTLSLEDIRERALKADPMLIVLDSSTPSIYNDLNVAKQLKQALPACCITMVGPHVSALPEETMQLSPCIDVIAREEYDQTLLELVRCLNSHKDLTKVQGISFRSGETIRHNQARPKIDDLDNIPFVTEVYAKHLSVRDYFFAAAEFPMVQIFTARGCPYRCFFCVYPQTIHGNVYRARSPENVAAEFRYIRKNLPQVREVVIEDDTFTVNKARVREICRLLIKDSNPLKWNANVRADLDLETMKLMKQAGCRLIIIGFESADQTVLDNINKGADAGSMGKFFRDTKKAGLLVHAAFMAGNPGETEESLAKTFDFARRYMPDTVQFFPLMAYPGTRAYAWACENNYLISDRFSDWVTEEGLHNCVVSIPGMSARRLVEWCDKSRRRYYLSIHYLIYKLGLVILHPREFKRTVIAGIKFSKYLVRGSFKTR